VLLPDPAGNELAVLGPEIENGDPVTVLHGGRDSPEKAEPTTILDRFASGGTAVSH